MGRYQNRLHPVGIALLLALAVTALWGARSLQRQEDLEQKTVRLHVIANSDSEADQALKLRVRDRVLTLAERILSDADSREEAVAELEDALPALERAAEEEIAARGYGYGVSARLERAEFPHKTYGDFALPAGEYTALRVVIGEGKGQNWWCVVFPPLCTTAASDRADTAIAAGWGQDDLDLVTEADQGYVLRFRSVEIWQAIRRWLGK